MFVGLTGERIITAQERASHAALNVARSVEYSAPPALEHRLKSQGWNALMKAKISKTLVKIGKSNQFRQGVVNQSLRSSLSRPSVLDLKPLSPLLAPVYSVARLQTKRLS